MALLRLGSTAALGWAIQQGAADLDAAATCPGAIDVPGYGQVHLVATRWNVPKDPAEKVEVVDGKVLAHLKGRSYFANSCQAGQYNYQEYAAVNLLGKALRFTTDLSAAGCGCNAALYLTNLQQNSDISGCLDYYCDANSVCGVACPEIDVMEANRFAWHSTLHAWDDKFGKGGGYGGGGPRWNGARDWTSEQYGPGGTCIDTDVPFEVTAGFPVDGQGNLTAMEVTLAQAGRPCDLRLSIGGYDGNTTKWAAGGGHGMSELTDALRAGMTPIASFWQSKDMLWMDGKGNDTLGPCTKDLAKPCPKMVPMYDFSVENLPPIPASLMRKIAVVLAGFFGIIVLVICVYCLLCERTHEPFSSESETGESESNE